MTLAVSMLLLEGAACGPDLGEQLAGRRFVSTAAFDDGVERTIVPGTALTVGFDDDGLGSGAGCNGMSAEYSIEDDKLVLGQGSKTELACMTPLAEQEDWYFGLLHARPTVSLSGDELVLATKDDRVEYLDREVAIPDVELVDTTWKVHSILTGKLATGGTWDPSATMRLAGDGTATFYTGCNDGTGNYAVEGNTIVFSNLEYSKTFCVDDNAQMLEDGWHRTVTMDRPVTWDVDEGRLTLRNGSDGLMLVAEP